VVVGPQLDADRGVETVARPVREEDHRRGPEQTAGVELHAQLCIVATSLTDDALLTPLVDDREAPD
jgi:hypothetical protein